MTFKYDTSKKNILDNVNFNDEINKINERCNRLDLKFTGLSKHTKKLQDLVTCRK